ncbi:MAG: YidC/Oxa1 family membrane protein insertase, partial [Candidatus Hydrogenedentes bacterium]|nr:YidC/Oxa1 family membrane protein insertase [Candidatus Hydrogenedentota bacterium]
FLWIADLSQPDTIWRIPGLDFPLNLLPLLMGATSIWQTHVTPMSGMEKSQAMMMKFMPLLFVAICYNFSSALALYWTVQNLIAVFQTYRNLAQPAPKLEKKKRPKGRWAMLMEQARQAAEVEKENRRRKKQKGR